MTKFKKNIIAGGRPVAYIGGGQKSSQTAELLDYTVTETWEASK